MTIIVDITPEVQAELARQAAAQGRAVEAYAASLLAEAAHLPAGTRPRTPLAAKDMVELFAPLRGLNLDFERDRDPGRDIEL
jgi:plasmid stability protein